MLVIFSLNLTTLPVLGSASLPSGTPPPKYKYPVPSSSTKTAGSKSQVTFAQLGVALLINGLPIGSIQGPVGESLVNTPIPFPLLAK